MAISVKGASGKERGFILLSVLMAVTLLITTATAFAWFANTESKRVLARENILKYRNAAEIALFEVGRKIAADSNKYDSLTEPLYAPGQETKINVGEYGITAKITPLDDKISVNGLFLPDGVTVRKEYETAWNKIWDELEHPELAAAVIDFMDKDEKQKLGGAERAGNINRPISDFYELKGMPDLDDEILWGSKKKPGGLDRYFTAMGGQKININMASPEMIEKLDEGLTLSHAKSIAAYRILSPLKNAEDLKKVPGFPPELATKLTNVIGYESQYFLVRMKVTNAAGYARNYKIILQRQSKKCRIAGWEE